MSKRVGVTAVGIHLGTTYSYVAAWFGNHYRVEIIPNKQGNKLTPSCVAWDGRKLLVGEHAVTRKSKSTIFGKLFFLYVEGLNRPDADL